MPWNTHRITVPHSMNVWYWCRDRDRSKCWRRENSGNRFSQSIFSDIVLKGIKNKMLPWNWNNKIINEAILKWCKKTGKNHLCSCTSQTSKTLSIDWSNDYWWNANTCCRLRIICGVTVLPSYIQYPLILWSPSGYEKEEQSLQKLTH